MEEGDYPDALAAAQEELDDAHADGYDEGYDAGHEAGYKTALNECRVDWRAPISFFADLAPFQWQDWFDRLKAEAARLGVRV
jgi:flagellar biosynthesis/type III secretory pathway protein FliH